MTVYLSLENLLALVDEAGLQAARDIGLLDSAAQRPRASAFGEDAYPSLDEKVAVVVESIVRNHPLIEGNKRLEWLAAYTMYGRNGVLLDAPEDDAYDLVIGIAEGRIDYHESAAMLATWTA